MNLPFQVPFGRLSGLLSRSLWFQCWCEVVFTKIFNSRLWRYPYQALLSGLILYSVASHREPLTMAFPDLWPVVTSWILPAFAVVTGLVLSAIPTALIGLNARRTRHAELALDRRLVEILKRLQGSGTRLKHGDFSTWARSLETASGKVFILTPVATFFLADKLLEAWGDQLTENEDFKNRLKAAAPEAPGARWAINKMTASLHLLVPDGRNTKVTEFISARAEKINFPAGSTLGAFRQTLAWSRDLLKDRTGNRTTSVHRIGFVPSQRILATSDWCLFQSFPTREPGFGEPLWYARRKDDEREFEALLAILGVLCWPPD